MMIVKCNPKDENLVLNYIGTDYTSCLYLYLDFKKYGFNMEEMQVYIQYDMGTVTSILLQYYSCLHIYSKTNNFCVDEMLSFFKKKNFTIIYCTTQTADLVYPALSKLQVTNVKIVKGWVAQIKEIDRKSQKIAVKACGKDFDQIARLIYDDEDIGQSYNLYELSKQLKERNQQGYARNLVIKKDDLVIAHACTNAEYQNIAVVAELLVRKEYRRKGYASEIWRDVCEELLDEGKEVYSIYYSRESRNLHKHIGFYEICEWAKIVIK